MRETDLARSVKRAAALMLLIAGASGCGGGGTGAPPAPLPAPGPAATGENVTWDRWTPYIIPYERTEPVLYEVAISGAVTGAVTLSAGDKTITLADDGANGDRVARDGIWSTRIEPALILARNTPERVHRPFIGFLTINGGKDAYNVIAEVSSAGLPTVPVYSLADGGQETSYVANYAATPAQLLAPDRKYWARRFYASHGDDYDFVQVVMVGGRRGNRTYDSVRNAVEGIGKPLVDRSEDAGSKGRLLGIALYPMSTGFDPAEKVFAHEIGHQWINFLPGASFAPAQPHWPLGSVGANIMGSNLAGGVGGDHPFVYEPNPAGYVLRAAPPEQTSIFNMLELYMMGLASAAEVPEYVILKGQGRQVGTGTQLSASDVQVIRVADIVAAAGPRKPDASVAQRHFRVATVVVSERPLNAREMSFFDFFARRAEATTVVPCALLRIERPQCYPWHLATGGRSTMGARIP